jgi:hypothetical protein
MPSVNSVSSLLQLSVAHIVTRIVNLDTPANSTTNICVMGELVKLFHQLRKLNKEDDVFDRFSITSNLILITFKYYFVILSIASSLLEQVIIAYAKNGIDRPEAFILEYLISTHLRFARFHVYSEGYLTVFPRFENLISLILRFSEAGNNCLRELGIHCKNLRYVKSIYLMHTIINSFRFLIVLLWTGYWMFSIVGMSQTQEFNYCVSIHTIILF